MCRIPRVRWTLTPLVSPEPWIACSGCGTPKPFRSSGRIRLNANGRKLDAWLIYRCRDCERTWNRPLIERRPVGEIDPVMLDALHVSDPAWVRAREFDIDDLRRRAQRIEEFADSEMSREQLDEGEDRAAGIEIELRVTLPTSLRLDRLLAKELGLSRSRLDTLQAAGRLRIDPERRDALHRRVRDRTHITLDLSGAGDAPDGE